MAISHPAAPRHSSPNMDAHDACVFIRNWVTDTFDSWSQIHNCLLLPYHCLKAT